MNAAATTVSPERPNLEDEAKARCDCRNGLIGLACRHAGRLRRIRSSSWDADSRLVVYLDGDRESTLAADVVLAASWAPSCCRSKLTPDGLPKPKRRKGAR